jgi:hypothetical protein
MAGDAELGGCDAQGSGAEKPAAAMVDGLGLHG